MLAIESDNYVRTFGSKAAIAPYADTASATFLIVPVTVFEMNMSNNVSLPTLKQRIAGYSSMINDGTKILSPYQAQKFIKQIEAELDAASTDKAAFADAMASENDLIALIVKFRKTFGSLWDATKYPSSFSAEDATIISNYFATKLGVIPAGTTLNDDMHAAYVKGKDTNGAAVSGAGNLLSDKLYNAAATISSADFEALGYSDKIANLQSRIPTLTKDSIVSTLYLLKGLVVKPATTQSGPTPRFWFLEAFNSDIDAINKFLSDVRYTNAYRNADQNSITSIIDDIKKGLSTNITVDEYYADLAKMLDIRPFTATNKDSFKKKLDRVVLMRGQSKDVATLVQNLIDLINYVVNDPMQFKGDPDAAKLLQMRADISGLDLTTKTVEAYSSKVQGIINLVKKKTETGQSDFTATSVQEFVTRLEDLKTNKVDALASDLTTLTNFLNSTEIISNSIIYFYQYTDPKTNSNVKLLDKISSDIKELNKPIPFDSRVSNMQSFIRNNPATNFITIDGSDNALIKDPKDQNKTLLETTFLPLFFGKLELMCNDRTSISTASIQNISSLIDFVKSNQLQKSMTSVLNLPGSMFNTKTISAALDKAIAKINGQYTDDDNLTLTQNIAALSALIPTLVTQSPPITEADRKKIIQDKLVSIINQKIDATDEDIKNIKALCELVRWSVPLNGSGATKNSYDITDPISKAAVSGDLPTLLDTYLLKYLSAPLTYQEVKKSLDDIKSTASMPFNAPSGALFIKRLQKLSTVSLDKLEAADVDERIKFLTEIKFNYFTGDADKAAVDNAISIFSKAKQILSAAASTGQRTIPNYQSLNDDFNTTFKSPSSTTWATDLKTKLTALNTYKAYAKQTTLNDLTTFFGSPTYTQNNDILWKNVGDQLKGTLTEFLKPLTIDQDYAAFKDIVTYLGTASATLNNYNKVVISEKLVKFYDNKQNMFAYKIDLADFRYTLQLLKTKATDQNISVSSADKFKDLDDLDRQITYEYQMQQIINLPFSARITNLQSWLSQALTDVNMAEAVMIMLDAGLVSRKIEGAAADFTSVSNIVGQLLYNDQFIANVTKSTRLSLTTADAVKQKLTDLQTSIAKPATNSERVNWLNDTLAKNNIPNYASEIIITELSNLANSLRNDLVPAASLSTLFSNIQKAIYNPSMASYQAKLTSALNTLKSVAGPIVGIAGIQSVQAVQVQLDMMDDKVESLNAILDSFDSLVSNRFNLAKADLDQIQNMLVALSLKDAFVKNKTALVTGSTNLTIANKVANYGTLLAETNDFAKRFTDLVSYYDTGIKTTPVSADVWQIYSSKLSSVVNLKSEALVSDADDETKDKIYALILHLQKAAYNKLSSKASDLNTIAQGLTSFRESAKKKMGISFKSRIKEFQALLTKDVNVKNFMVVLNGLISDRAQGTNSDRSDLSTFILGNPVISDNLAIVRSGIIPEIRAAASALKAPVKFADRFAELQRMLNNANFQDPTKKEEFYTKIKEAVDERSSAINEKFDTKLMKDLINIAIGSVYQDGDTFTEGTAKKSYDEALSALQTAWDSGSTSSSYVTFASKLQTLRDDINKLSDPISEQDAAKQAVANLLALAKNAVDAMPEDIINFQNYLASGELRGNEVIYVAMNKSFNFTNEILAALNAPIAYADRVKNLTDLFRSDVTVFEPAIKDAFVRKSEVLFNLRATGQAEKFPLADLKTFWGVVIARRYNTTTDKVYVDKLNNFASNLLTMPTQQVSTQNFDFNTNIAEIKAIADMSKVVDNRLQTFLAAISKAVNNKINSVFTDDSTSSAADKQTDQTVLLYNYLVSSAVLNSDFVFDSAGKQAETVKQAAAGLLTPVSLNDLMQNFQAFYDASDFTKDSAKTLLLGKVDKFVRLKNNFTKEAFDPANLLRIIDYLLSNKLSKTEAAYAKLAALKTQLTSQDQTTSSQYKSFAEAWSKLLISTTNQTGFLAVTNNAFTSHNLNANNIQKFVDAVEALSVDDLKSDATAQELTISTTVLGNSRILDTLFKNSKSIKDKYDAALAKLAAPLSFDSIAKNIIDFIDSFETFTDAQQLKFVDKLKNVAAKKNDGYNQGYDMDTLNQWLDYAARNQMAGSKYNDDAFKALINAVKVAPKAGVVADKYVSFLSNFRSRQNTFRTFTKAAADKAKVQSFIDKDLPALIKKRVDAYVFDPESGADNGDVIALLRQFMDNDVRNNYFVFGKLNAATDGSDYETRLNGLISNLDQPITYAELITNLIEFIGSANIFSNQNNNPSENHVDAFINKVERLIYRRSEATADQKTDIVRRLNFAKVNKFQSPEEGDSIITDLITRFSETPTTASSNTPTELSNILTAAEAFVVQQSDDTIANATDDVKYGWIATQLNPLAYSTFLSKTTPSDAVQRIYRLMDKYKNRVFVGDVNADRRTKVDKLKNQVLSATGQAQQ